MKTDLYTRGKAKARAQRIMAIYDATSTAPWGPSVLNVVNESRIRVIYSPKDAGGMIITKNNQGNVWRVMYVAFEENNRGKGLLRRCFSEAKKIGCDIALIDMNMGDDFDMWAHLGFSIPACLPDLTMVASNRELPFLNKVTIGDRPKKVVNPAPHITCPKCKKDSYSAGDIKAKFCIDCGYHSDLVKE